MRVAVVIMAYLGSPNGVAQLSDYFASTDADLYLHVDAKVSSLPYESLLNRANLTVLRNREEIFWGGFNTVRAVISAIEVALASHIYDRFVVITEDSIPLVTPSLLMQMLDSDTEWIDYGTTDLEWVWQRYRGYYCFDSFATSPRHFDPSQRSFDAALLTKLGRMADLAIEGKSPLNVMSVGSSWWALSRAAIEVVLTKHRSDKRFRESFEFSAIPEEHYFQTILALEKWSHPTLPLMHTDFSRFPKPYVYHDLSEIQLIRAKETCPFLRKVDLQHADIAKFVVEMSQ